MQTFLPYPDFAESARALDMKRLGNQRNENFVIMRALLGDERYAYHPVTKQWEGYESALMAYHLAICHEWHTVRGYKDTVWAKVLHMYVPSSDPELFALTPEEYAVSEQRARDMAVPEMPPWFGDERYHQSHRENLLFKNYEFYRPVFPDDEPSDDKVYPAQV